MTLLDLLMPSFIADISNLPWIAIIAVSGGFLVAIVAMVSGIWFAQRRQQMWHETARVALEKGQPLPPALDDDGKAVEPKKHNRYSDIRTGLILIAVGGGLYLFFDGLGGSKFAFVGAIPGFIGVALLLYGLASAAFGSKQTPPQS
jgi:hypothetical protein